MIGLKTFIPRLVQSVGGFFVKYKELSTKKKIAVIVSVPVSLILFTLTLKFAGAENAEMASNIIIITIEAILELL